MAESADQGTSTDTNVPSLTPKQVELILSTWALVKLDKQKHGTVMFCKLFEIAPDLVKLFPFEDHVMNEEHPGLRKHALQVMDSIDGAIGLLGNPEQLKEVLLELGIVHNMNDVKLESFAPVGEALIYALASGLQELFTEEVKQSWIALYAAVQYFMTMGMVEGLDAGL